MATSARTGIRSARSCCAPPHEPLARRAPHLAGRAARVEGGGRGLRAHGLARVAPVHGRTRGRARSGLRSLPGSGGGQTPAGGGGPGGGGGGGWCVADCDLFLDPEPDNLQRWARFLVEDGWALAVWNVPVPLPLDLEALRGRYYVRARKDTGVMDGTYEHDTLSPRAVVAGARLLGGLPVMDLETLLALKRGRGTPRDLEHLAQVEHWRRSQERR